ncbi:MAG: hypothetical protein JJU28_20195 [Cyclobacteriaceae bacterium]|nr:hypothetical protein [Cyclobacteriaceae bacterium]
MKLSALSSVKLLIAVFVFLRMVLAQPLLYAQTENIQQETLFSSNTPIEIDLYFNIDEVLADRSKDASQHEALLKYFHPSGEVEEHEIQVKTRGNFRLDPANCDFPPLRINFKKKQVKGTFFAGEDKLKLVTQCQLERYVLMEYLIYRVYNAIEEKSFKVRLAKINYYNTSKNKKAFTHYGFFIESDDNLTERLEATEAKRFYSPNMLNQENLLKLSLFQYMIGNADWYVTSKHNTVLLINSADSIPFAVPYDFDFSEAIDGFYTKPKGVPSSQLKTRRIFKGNCLENDEYLRGFDFFIQQKDTIYQTLQNFELGKKSVIRQLEKYFDKFYQELQNPDKLIEELNRYCWKPAVFRQP